MIVPGRSEFLLNPRRRSAFGAPASIIQLSTLPSGFFTSRWIQACGLIHSIEVTVPVIFTGFCASYSAAKEWCAITGAATASSSPAPTATNIAFACIALSSTVGPPRRPRPATRRLLFYNRLPDGGFEIALELRGGRLHHDDRGHLLFRIDVDVAAVGPCPAI